MPGRLRRRPRGGIPPPNEWPRPWRVRLTGGCGNGMPHLQNVRGSLMPRVTLYHWEPNAHSRKTMLALMEKGGAVESPYLHLLKFDQHPSHYLALNPPG